MPSQNEFRDTLIANPAAEYIIDTVQRSILFLDTMRRRGNQYHDHLAKIAPHVLEFNFELIMDGRTLDRPVNYVLIRILPPDDVQVDPTQRPFVIVDPRAGHGPGIGGFKADSEIGVALKAGHPCYFVGFLPEPMPGQTIEDIGQAEAKFLEKVMALHPEADGKPCVIGNCQGGWAVMMLAAGRPELFGPLILAGSPLSYWDGIRGKNPMRYTGGLLGGSWLVALMSDLGLGKFDGAWLVQNFENLNPSNTFWSKQYNLYENIDTEAERYLGFERWWGGHVNLNAEEIQFIVDELFVGNKLAAGEIQTSDGATIDLRVIRSPIVVFCSEGDNITPPAQALGWLLDLYDNVDELRSHGQTVVYSVHESAGHLGIFVSGGVARKEHGEFASNIDFIELLPPGLYEAVFEKRTAETAGGDHVSGEWIMRCEPRTLDDIRALGVNDSYDERRFATAARVSETNLALYRAWMQPWVRAMLWHPVAEMMYRLHPSRLQYELFSDVNPFMVAIKQAAELAREHRTPAGKGNPFIQMQDMISRQIITALDAFRDVRDRLSEQLFLAVYGSPILQAACGIDPKQGRALRKAGKSLIIQELIQKRIAELKAKIPEGGVREALVRGLLFVGLERGGPDERGFEAIRRLRGKFVEGPPLSVAEFKSLVRDQYFMLLLDQDSALAAIPTLLRDSKGAGDKGLSLVKEVLTKRGDLTPGQQERFQTISRLFQAEASPVAPRKVVMLAGAAVS